MKVVAIISQKGGAGKTTLAVHLAAEASAAGHVAALIDLDPQATAERWGDRRLADRPEVISGKAVRLPSLLSTAKDNGASFIVLDTAPNADHAAGVAASVADLVLIPCRPATFDLEAIETTLMLAKTAGKPSYVVLNAVPPLGFIGREAAAGLEEQGALVSPRQICDRVALRYAVIDGRVAREYEPGGKASQEIEELYLWMCRTAGIPAQPHAGTRARGRTGVRA